MLGLQFTHVLRGKRISTAVVSTLASADFQGDHIMHRQVWALAAIVALGATMGAACTSAPTADEAELAAQVADGRAIAERECASCHALDHASASPRADAPPMQDLLARYDENVLANDLIEGIKLGHPDMPQFDFSVLTADALVAYLMSVQVERD